MLIATKDPGRPSCLLGGLQLLLAGDLLPPLSAPASNATWSSEAMMSGPDLAHRFLAEPMRQRDNPELEELLKDMRAGRADDGRHWKLLAARAMAEEQRSASLREPG